MSICSYVICEMLFTNEYFVLFIYKIKIRNFFFNMFIISRYGSALECGSSYCKDLGYREHFHCMDCSGRVFCKKEEMIRHFKVLNILFIIIGFNLFYLRKLNHVLFYQQWHKKRDDSLAHGFMRYSPLDDCGERGTGCPHNRSQTHYHCIQDGCDKVFMFLI